MDQSNSLQVARTVTMNRVAQVGVTLSKTKHSEIGFKQK